MGPSSIQLFENMFECQFEHALRGYYLMKHENGLTHPPSSRNDINLEEMTLREVGEWAELHGLKLLDVLTL